MAGHRAASLGIGYGSSGYAGRTEVRVRAVLNSVVSAGCLVGILTVSGQSSRNQLRLKQVSVNRKMAISRGGSEVDLSDWI